MTDPNISDNADNFWWSRPIMETDHTQETRFITRTEEPQRVSIVRD